jgi:hypothetical protein
LSRVLRPDDHRNHPELQHVSSLHYRLRHQSCHCREEVSPSFSPTPVHMLTTEFPAWMLDVFSMEEHPTAIARSPGKAGIEVMAQGRANGKLIDHFKVTVNGSENLNVNFPLSALFSVADLPDWRVQWDIWPRDIPISGGTCAAAAGWTSTAGSSPTRCSTLMTRGPSRRSR